MALLVLISSPLVIISMIILSSQATAQSQPSFVLPVLYRQPQAQPQPVYEGQSIQWECGVNTNILREMGGSGLKSVKWWRYNDDGKTEEIKDTENKQARIFISTVDNNSEYAKILILSGIRQSDARDYQCKIEIHDGNGPHIYSNWQKLKIKSEN